MKKLFFLFVFLMLVLVISGCGSSGANTVNFEDKVTIYKSPNCGCCVGYSSELKKQGFDVEVINVDNMNTIKDKYNIPRNMESCHTAVVGDYFVEGHVPIEAIEKLLEDNLDIGGIALPNMPAGSPGMPGIKSEPFRVYSLTDGKYVDFMEI